MVVDRKTWPGKQNWWLSIQNEHETWKQSSNRLRYTPHDLAVTHNYDVYSSNNAGRCSLWDQSCGLCGILVNHTSLNCYIIVLNKMTHVLIQNDSFMPFPYLNTHVQP